MIELTSPEVIRPVNIVVLLAIILVLSYRYFRRHHNSVLDERIASGACIAVFAVLALGSGVNYSKGVQMGPIVPYFTLTLLVFLVTLITPWHWHLPRRRR